MVSNSESALQEAGSNLPNRIVSPENPPKTFDIPANYHPVISATGRAPLIGKENQSPVDFQSDKPINDVQNTLILSPRPSMTPSLGFTSPKPRPIYRRKDQCTNQSLCKSTNNLSQSFTSYSMSTHMESLQKQKKSGFGALSSDYYHIGSPENFTHSINVDHQESGSHRDIGYLNARGSSLSSFGEKRQNTFPLTLLLPNDTPVVLLCNESSSVDSVIDQALVKLKSFMGLVLDKRAVSIVVDGNTEQSVLSLGYVLGQLPYIRMCRIKNIMPRLRLVLQRYPDSSVQFSSRCVPEVFNSPSSISSCSSIEEGLNEFFGGDEISSLSLLPAASKNRALSLKRRNLVHKTSYSHTNNRITTLSLDSVERFHSGTVDERFIQRRKNTSSSIESLEMKRNSWSRTYSENLIHERSKNSSSRIRSLCRSIDSNHSRELSVHEVNSRKDFLPSIMHGVSYVKSHIYKVEFKLEEQPDVVLKMEVNGDQSISTMKNNLWKHPALENLGIGAKSDYEIFYKCLNTNGQPCGEPFILYDEQQIFHTLSILSSWNYWDVNPEFWIRKKYRRSDKYTQAMNKRLGSAIGYGLYRFEYLKDLEVEVFRRNMVSARRHAVDQRDSFVYAYEPDICESELSPLILNKLSPSMVLTFKLHVPFANLIKTMTCDALDSPKTIISKFLEKYAGTLPKNCRNPEDFYLKACGIHILLVGSYSIIDFNWIRKCVIKDNVIEIKLCLTSECEDLAHLTDKVIEEFDPIEDPCEVRPTHTQLTVEGRNESEISAISLWDIARNFRAQIVAGENLTTGAVESLYVEAGIYHGGDLLCPLLKTHQVSTSRDPRWASWLNFDIPFYNIPREARLCITVYGRWNAKKKMSKEKDRNICPISWVNFLVFDYKGYLKQGIHKLGLWKGDKANPIGTCSSSQGFGEPSIYVKLENFDHPVIFPSKPSHENEFLLETPEIFDLSELDSAYLQKLLQKKSAPFAELDSTTKSVLWRHRYSLVNIPDALPKVLMSARWFVLDDVLEVRKLLRIWSPPSPESALELLDANFGDQSVRSFAVSRLESLSDMNLKVYLMQLVQVLKYEPYLDCALARFLLKRALLNREIGHYLFWYLRAEIENPEVSVKFAVLLEAYLRGCGSYYVEKYVDQILGLSALNDVSLAIKKVKSSQERREVLKSKFQKVTLPKIIQLALNPRLEVKGLVAEKCKFMDSKKLPLWCVFSNSDSTGKDVHVIFKNGDDLRQDMLTLQMIRLMDNLWQNEGIDLKMLPYECIATGKDVGMIEVVLHAETVSRIQLSCGGSSAAFKDQPLDEWLRKQNPLECQYRKAVDIFTRSCAGYCVATYVLGIGDRHNDNIMLTTSGHLFHIDFGHFLGNIKRKFGIKRERAPFVLTPDFVYVMGQREGKEAGQFKQFVEYCTTAYLILRKNATIFLNLFAMMISTGIPELQCKEDMSYLHDALCLDMSDEEAAHEFRNLIFESLRLGWSTQLNWWIHNVVHGGK